MSTYKVIQDIEAEDKLLGPLTLRQFIYAAIVAVCGFVVFKLIFIKWFLALPFLPPMILFGVLAAPFGHDQSSEIWLLAKIRFYLKPRIRIWDQSGMKELVTVTAPKKVERHYTNGLTQEEVQSRLEVLARTIDSRGWAVKNVNVNMTTQPSYATSSNASDRLIDPSTMAREVPTYDITVADDMLDEKNNPTAQNLDRMINDTAQKRRQELLGRMKEQEAFLAEAPKAKEPNDDLWFMNGAGSQTPQYRPGYARFDHNPLVTPSAAGAPGFAANQQPTVSAAEEQELLRKIKEEQNRPDPMHSHLKTILPLEEQERLKREALEEQQRAQAEAAARAAAEAAQINSQAAMKTAPDPAILELAVNDDFNIATIARQANKAMQHEEDGEVVINLH
jgi:hypothetical protein